MIDITFDFRSDTPSGKDPDTFSPTLRTYHQLLWSKPLPSGAPFELGVTGPPYYLHHRSELAEFWLSSDTVVPSFRWLAPIIDQIPEVEREQFMHVGYTIGGPVYIPGHYNTDKSKDFVFWSESWSRRVGPQINDFTSPPQGVFTVQVPSSGHESRRFQLVASRHEA